MENKVNRNYLLIIFILIQILFMIMCVISIPKLIDEDKIDTNNVGGWPNISIAELKESMSDSNANDVEIMKWMLFDTVRNNKIEINPNTDKAILRRNSIRKYYFEKQNINYYSAIVDIPEIRQSYWIFHEYSSDRYNANLSANGQYIILCVIDPGKIIYPEFNCKDNYGASTYNLIAGKYVKWFDFNEFFIYEIAGDDYNIIRIAPNSPEATSEEIEGYVEETKKKIRDLGIMAELFEYEIVEVREVK